MFGPLVFLLGSQAFLLGPLALRTGRIGPRNSPQGRCKGCLQPLRFALTGLRFAARWLLQQAHRQVPRHHMERRKTIALVLVIPRADGGAMALASHRGPSRRHQRQAGLVLPQQHARPGLGFFSRVANST